MALSTAYIILNILVILAGCFITACGIYLFVNGLLDSIIVFVLGIYYLLAGVCIVLLEIVFPQKLVNLFGFYTYWFGKGALISLIGLLILGNRGFFLAAGIIVIAVGIVCMIFHFILGCPRPLVNRSVERKPEPQGQHA
ncbi:hypothetical protein ACTFIV_000333 [Dictyostelium citrinum]